MSPATLLAAEGGQTKEYKKALEEAKTSRQSAVFEVSEEHYLAAVREAEGLKQGDQRLPEALHYLAGFYMESRRYESAEECSQRALKLREQSVGTNNIGIAGYLLRLGDIQRYLNQLDKAEITYERALKIINSKLGAFHPASAPCVLGLATVRRAQNRVEEADDLYKKALKLSRATVSKMEWRPLGLVERTQSSSWADPSSVLNNYAMFCLQQKRLGEAEKMLNEAQNIIKAKYGKDNRSLSGIWNNLALVYIAQTNYAKAQFQLEQALAIERKTAGPDHPVVTETIWKLTLLQMQSPRINVAPNNMNLDAPGLEALFKALDQNCGTNHIQQLRLLKEVAGGYENRKSFVLAQQVWMRVLAVQEVAFGPDAISICTTLKTLSQICQQQEKLADALPFLERQTKIMAKQFGPADSRVADCIGDRAAILRKLNRNDDALALENQTKVK
jgi:tetratricopeptide (TPR) repeat protein